MKLISIAVMGLSAIWPVEAPPLSEPATANEVAVRLDIPEQSPTNEAPKFSELSSNGECVGLIPLLEWYSPGWDVHRMARIAYRESRCKPGAINPKSGTAGLFQISSINYRYLRAELGEPVSQWLLLDPGLNVRAARELFEYDGYQPWKL